MSKMDRKARRIANKMTYHFLFKAWQLPFWVRVALAIRVIAGRRRSR